MKHLFPSFPVALVLLLAAPGVPAQDEIGKKGREKIAIVWAEPYTTEHYEIHHESGVARATVQRVADGLEQALVQYEKVFKHEHEGDPLRVRFMENFNTYEQVGGDPALGGFFSPATGYLVIYDKPFYQLMPTVYHEAFHQYIHDYMEGDGGGPVAIPTWYNEGLASYFEGIQVSPKTKKLDYRLIDNRQLRLVQEKILTRQEIPLEKLLAATPEEFYNIETKTLYYGQSMAFAYFLMNVSGGKPVLEFAKTLKETRDPEKALAEIFGKERKKLKSIESKFKTFTVRVKLTEGTTGTTRR